MKMKRSPKNNLKVSFCVLFNFHFRIRSEAEKIVKQNCYAVKDPVITSKVVGATKWRRQRNRND